MILKAGLTVDLISNKIIEIKFRHIIYLNPYYIFESNNVKLINRYNCNVEFQCTLRFLHRSVMLPEKAKLVKGLSG